MINLKPQRLWIICIKICDTHNSVWHVGSATDVLAFAAAIIVTNIVIRLPRSTRLFKSFTTFSEFN